METEVTAATLNTPQVPGDLDLHPGGAPPVGLKEGSQSESLSQEGGGGAGERSSRLEVERVVGAGGGTS